MTDIDASDILGMTWDAGEPPGSQADGGSVPAPDLAAQVAARLCHDFISPASAIVSGLDLLEDPLAQDMREEAMNLIAGSAKKLVDLLSFCRVAFGASVSAETFDTRELETLTQGVYQHVRPTLDWRIPMPSLNKAAARTLLNLAQIAAGALPTGGVAKLTATTEGNAILFDVDAAGPRARLRTEVMDGLRGRTRQEGLGGQWVQAYYLHALLSAAGGRVLFAEEEGRVVLHARVPLDTGA